jgi:hypothetical protein
VFYFPASPVYDFIPWEPSPLSFPSAVCKAQYKGFYSRIPQGLNTWRMHVQSTVVLMVQTVFVRACVRAWVWVKERQRSADWVLVHLLTISHLHIYVYNKQCWLLTCLFTCFVGNHLPLLRDIGPYVIFIKVCVLYNRRHGMLIICCQWSLGFMG